MNEDNPLVINDLVDTKGYKVIPYPTNNDSCEFGTLGLYTLQEILEMQEKANIAAWLSSFNTDSATCCFTAVQQLKERVNE